MRGRGNKRSFRLPLPAALFLIGALSSPAASFAQDPPAGTAAPTPSATESAGQPELDEVAQKHYTDGQAAASRGDWQAAYTSFRAGLAVQEHPLLVRALGDASYHLGKYREAAETLSIYLRTLPATAPDADRKAAEKMLADATTKVAVLAITAPVGAEIFVDNLFVGKAPIARDVFVEPGPCSVEARSGAERGQQTITAEKGARTAVTLIYGVVSPDPPPTATASARPTSTAPVAPPEGPRKEIVLGGAIVTGAALVAGAVLLGLSSAKSAEEQQARIDLRRLGTKNLCAKDPVPECAVVKDTAAAKDAFGSSGSALLIGGLAVGAATLTYFLIKTYSNPSRDARQGASARGASPRAPSPSVDASLVVTPAGGLGLVNVRF